MLEKDRKEREKNGSTDELDAAGKQLAIQSHLKTQTDYQILNVSFPDLGETGAPEAEVMPWKKKGENLGKRGAKRGLKETDVSDTKVLKDKVAKISHDDDE